jgi:hypothetical protein
MNTTVVFKSRQGSSNACQSGMLANVPQSHSLEEAAQSRTYYVVATI